MFTRRSMFTLLAVAPLPGSRGASQARAADRRPAPVGMDLARLERIRDQHRRESRAPSPALRRLIKDADGVLHLAPRSVVEKAGTPRAAARTTS